jgi:hypothetical protein
MLRFGIFEFPFRLSTRRHLSRQEQIRDWSDSLRSPTVRSLPAFDNHGAFYDLLGNAIDIALKVRLPWEIGNQLIKDESGRPWVPEDIGDCQFRHWRFCGHTLKGVLRKIKVRTSQKSELMGAWNEDGIHVTHEFRVPASTRDIIRLKKSKFTIHLTSGNRGVPSAFRYS